MIYHIISRSDWEEAAGGECYRGDTLDTEGFIHCSTAEQVVDTANILFSGHEDLLLLEIDEERLSAEVRYEDAGDGRLFPHIYSPMEIAAVVKVIDFPLEADGRFTLPTMLKEE